MKCIYAIPSDASEVAREFSSQFAASLRNLSPDAPQLADKLEAFAETNASAVLKLDDDDWSMAQSTILASLDDHALAGLLYWSLADAERVRKVLDQSAVEGAQRSVASWLSLQTGRERSFVLLAQ